MTDDRSLIEKTLAGDMQAFRWLIKRYERMIGHIVGRIVRNDSDREEVCQDVFLKVYDKLHTFRMESKLSTWMVTIAYRTSLNFIEKKRQETVELSEVRGLAVEEPSLSAMEYNDLKKTLEAAIMRLPLPYRTAVTLFHLQDHSYEEVADITGMPVGTVKSNLFRARKMLKEYLEKQQKNSPYE